MSKATGYAAFDPATELRPWHFERREPREDELRIDIDWCGICHSDLHTAKGEWQGTRFPVVPGHEIVGRVAKTGRKVKRFKVGDVAAVGCLVDSCRKCGACRKGLEQHCEKPASFTYNSYEQDGATPTQGGYSTHIVVPESFALKLKKGLPLERVAPLLCAGITTYSPLKRHGARKGSKVGVVGLGGLGHVAVKLAKAMGAEVTVLSRSTRKAADAKKLGARALASTSDPAALEALRGKLDLIIDTVSGPHDVNALLGLLKMEGKLVMVGASPEPFGVGAFPLIMGRRAVVGSLIGGIAETQEMLDFCARKGVLADVEVIKPEGINSAYQRLAKGDVRYRFVVDVARLRP